MLLSVARTSSYYRQPCLAEADVEASKYHVSGLEFQTLDPTGKVQTAILMAVGFEYHSSTLR